MNRTVQALVLTLLFIPILPKAEAVQEPTNRLGSEKSPYLLQHAHNPVDWYPWGEEAFEKARKEDKPVLVSIGYSTCHWCHVMEEESFENADTANVMNENFVSIKVDREERPDIDSVYMGYVMAATGSGGWPMNVFLTPDKKPFYGGTYFPPEDRYGMPSFKNLLVSIADSWKNRRNEITESADSAVKFLNNAARREASTSLLSADTLAEAYKRFDANFDEEYAGFGGAPKFPRSHTLSMILRYWARTRDPRALEIVEKTLIAMADGGMYDQLGGGFHRYSTDGRWRVPHFEKMLYDQAILARSYLEAYQSTRDPRYARIAREVLDYVSERMTGPEGGFFSAEDADSTDPGDPTRKREGAYFVWKKSEIEKVLSPKDAEIFCRVYGIAAKGNALSDPHHEFTDQNVLYVAHPAEKTEIGSLQASKKKLLAIRTQRPAPYLDDKVLTDWNGLMISAFAYAAVVLEEPRYAEAAKKAAVFVRTKLRDGGGGLLHRYREGAAGITANLNDYSFLIYGTLALYEATFDPEWLAQARMLTEQMLQRFWDKEASGFFLTADDAEPLITRPKELYDGAVPSGNSIAALDLLLLGRFTGEGKYDDFAQKTLSAFSSAITQDPANCPQMLIALDFSIGPAQEIVIAGRAGDALGVAMHREINARFIPNKIVLFHEDGASGEALEVVAPFVKDKKTVHGKTAAYLCRGHVCQLPVTDLKALKERLNG